MVYGYNRLRPQVSVHFNARHYRVHGCHTKFQRLRVKLDVKR